MSYNKILFNILISFTAVTMHLTLYTMVIPQIEIVTHTEEPIICSICLEICEENSLATFLGCREHTNGAHIFHTTCINQWFLSNQNCPLCRKVITLSAERIYIMRADIINNQLRQKRKKLREEQIRTEEENRRLRETIMRLEEVNRKAENEAYRRLSQEHIRAENEANRRANEAYREAEHQIMFELNQEQSMSRARQKFSMGLGSVVGMLGGALFNKLGQTKSALIAKGALIGIPIAAFLYSFHKFPNNNVPRTEGATTGYALGFLASMFVVAIGNKLQSKQNENDALEYTEPLEQDVDTE